MIKLFFITFFAAELIIAFTVIFKIYRLDKCVNELNKTICGDKDKIKSILVEIRSAISEFREKFEQMQELIRRKKEEYLLNTTKTLLIYLSLFFLKGRYKKAVLAYQLISEIYEAFDE